MTSRKGKCHKCDDLAVIYTPHGKKCAAHWTEYNEQARPRA